MSSTQFLCSICQDHHALEHMRSIPCGHAYCADCLSRYASGRGQHPCPQCRTSFRIGQVHPIFLELADSPSQQPLASGSGEPACHSDGFHYQLAKSLRDINQVEEDQRFQTVARAAKGLEDVYGLMDRRDCMLELLTAIAARWQGMLPVFNSLSKQRSDIVKLKDELKQTQRGKTHAENVARQAIETSERTMPVLTKTKEDLAQTQQELGALKRVTEEYKVELQKQREEVGGLRTRLHALKAQERKQKEEIKRLREENRETSRFLQFVAESQAQAEQDTQDSLDVQLSSESDDVGLEFLTSDVDSSRHPAFEPTTSRKRRRPEADECLPTFASETVIYSPRPSPRRPARREPLAVKPPIFSSDWNLPQPPAKQRKPASRSGAESLGDVGFPINLDEKGRPKGAVLSGSRQRLKP